MSMNEKKLLWMERTSKSDLIASVWSCSALVTKTRTALADPCISIALVSEGESMRVVLRGPETKPRNELLTLGYTCTTIRLQPGVLLQGFSPQNFINSMLALPVDTAGRFWFEGTCLQFPDFDNAELLIDQLYNLGYLSQEILSSGNIRAAKTLTTRSHARLIKRITGLSPYRLYQLQRMHQALRLLKAGMRPTAVALELDFVDQSHLTHASRQFLGHTPKQLLYVPQNP
jgi:AraC-like DNA-binding protein